jgi:hypothetical protein
MDRWGINETDGSGPLPWISIILGSVAAGYVVYDLYVRRPTPPSFQDIAVTAFMAFWAGALIGLPVSCILK